VFFYEYIYLALWVLARQPEEWIACLKKGKNFGVEDRLHSATIISVISSNQYDFDPRVVTEN